MSSHGLALTKTSSVGFAKKKNHPELLRRWKTEAQNRALYGQDYDRDAQLASQGGTCAICGIKGLTWGKGFNKVWHTDHVHGQEGTHRGVLCAACNTALGRLEPFLDKVIAYLAKYAVEQGTAARTT
jgi:predicted HNH restriction endonuclease